MARSQNNKRWLFKNNMVIIVLIPFAFFSYSNQCITGNYQSVNVDTTHKVPSVIPPDITIVSPGKKICQLVGEYDRERKQFTQNRTFSRYHLRSTDLGSPFRYGNRTYLLFGDTQGAIGGDRDAIAYTTDVTPDHGLALTFIHDERGIYKPVTIPGIQQGAYDVPMAGVEVNDKMYIYATTGHTDSVDMGESVIARSDDSGRTFRLLYTFSKLHFINVSVVKTEASKWRLLPENLHGRALIFWGTGTYRKSDVYLACQPANDIENKDAIRYFAGINDIGKPIWSEDELKAVPLFNQPTIGELSVTYNIFIHRWIMLYNTAHPRSILMRTAKYPWGPWTEKQEIFNAWKDGGFCHFIHVSWLREHCDSVMDKGRENDGGAVYGPYQYAYDAKGDSASVHPTTTIYFNMSTWNPYTVVLMKAELKKR